jgi:hypothetical protein
MREYPTLQLDTHLSKGTACFPLLKFLSNCKVGYVHVHLHSCLFLQQAVPLLKCVSNCKVGYSLMFIYIHVFSNNKLFIYLNLCLIVRKVMDVNEHERISNFTIRRTFT